MSRRVDSRIQAIPELTCTLEETDVKMTSSRNQLQGSRDVIDANLLNASQRRQSRASMDALRKLPVFRRLSIVTPNSRRGSVAGRTDISSLFGQSRGPPKLENTYRMTPHDDQSFNATYIEKMVQGILESYLDGEAYDERKCVQLSKHLSDVIKARVKDVDTPRYKVVCFVTMGRLQDAQVAVASRCLWNSDTDNFASATYKNSTLFCTATVFAVYFE